MFFSLKKDVFLTPYSKFPKMLKKGLEYKISNLSNLKEFTRVIKEYERKGDSFIHVLIVTVNKTFITPIEREDIHQLAM